MGGAKAGSCVLSRAGAPEMGMKTRRYLLCTVQLLDLASQVAKTRSAASQKATLELETLQKAKETDSPERASTRAGQETPRINQRFAYLGIRVLNRPDGLLTSALVRTQSTRAFVIALQRHSALNEALATDWWVH